MIVVNAYLIGFVEGLGVMTAVGLVVGVVYAYIRAKEEDWYV